MAESARPEPARRTGSSLPALRTWRWRRPGAVTVLEVDGTLLRVVQTALRGNRAAIAQIAVESLDLATDADRTNSALLGGAVGRALTRLRIKPGAVVMGVPRALVVLRTVSVPVIDDVRELASVIHLQIGKDLPFRLEEAVIDFRVSRQVGDKSGDESAGRANELAAESKNGALSASARLEVLVAAVKREVVDFHRQTAAAAGVKLVSLSWQSFANASCLQACAMAGPDESVALVTLRSDEVGVEVIAQQSLLHSRGAAIKLTNGHAQLAPAPSERASSEKSETAPPAESGVAAGPATFVDLVTIEVVRSLHSYGGVEQHLPVGRVLVSGATGQEPAVVAALQNRLNIPCVLFEPGAALDLPEPARGHAAGSISALGLALSANGGGILPFDFLNPKRPAVQRNTRRLRILLGASAAIAVLVVLGSLRSYLINQRLKVYRAAQTTLAAAEKKRPIYRQMTQQAATVRDWSKENRNWLEHYAYLSAVLPGSEEIYVNSISVGSQGSIRLGVQARSGEILANLDKRLRAAGYDLKPLAITPGADRYGYNFRSTVELTAPEKLKIDLTKFNAPSRPSDDASLDSPGRLRREVSGEAPNKASENAGTAPPNRSNAEASATTPARSGRGGFATGPNRPRWDGSSGNPNPSRRRGGGP